MAFDAFLKIEGIDGESTHSRYPAWIEVHSYSFGAQNAVAVSSTGGTLSGKPSFTDVSFVIAQSTASVPLVLAVANGQIIPTAQLALSTAGFDKTTEYYSVLLDNVLVTSFHEGATDGDDRPTNAISLSFAKITWSYRPQRDDGSMGTAIVGSYDLTKGTTS